jgi:hypothetical protein
MIDLSQMVGMQMKRIVCDAPMIHINEEARRRIAIVDLCVRSIDREE